MKDAALKLARLGFPVIPLHWPHNPEYECSCGNPACTSTGKHPLTPHGVTDASTDTAQVTAWWDQWPDANIGIATGHVCDVIDLDGPEACNSFTALNATHGNPDIIAIARTGRQEGWHYYTAGTGAPSWTGGTSGWPAHLDGKGKGGYVVAPPSLHETGRRYEWVWEPDFSAVSGDTPWPDWHERVHAALKPGPGPSQNPNGHNPDPAGLVIAQPWQTATQAFLDAVLARFTADVLAAGPGTRWQTLVIHGIWPAAGLVLGKELSKQSAVELCQKLATDLDLDSREIARVPREIDRALTRRAHPIQSRAAQGHADGTDAGTAPAGWPQPGQSPSGDLGPSSDAAELERLTRDRKLFLLASEAARREIAHDKAGAHEFQELETCTELISRQAEPVKYRIENVWPAGGRVVFSAQYKAGKTTLIGNLVRSLADGTSFLGRFPVTRSPGKIALFDTEMNPGMLRNWLCAQGIGNTDDIMVVSMRGKAGDLDLTNDMIRQHWAQQLKNAEISIVLLDCLGPVLAAAGLDEQYGKDIGEFLAAFEALLSDAQISEAMIVAHMGHTGERARGASRLRDWPDTEWHLIRDGQEDDTAPAPDVPRFFRAYGRDVAVSEVLLDYEPNMRWLTIGQTAGNRKQEREHHAASSVEQYVKEHPGQTGRMIRELIGGKTTLVLAALKELVAAGTVIPVERKKGNANAVFYYHESYREPVSEPAELTLLKYEPESD